MNLTLWKWLSYLKSAVGLETFAASTLTIFYLEYCQYSFLEFSLLLSLIGIFLLIIEVPVGTFADKFGRKITYLGGSVMYLLAMALLIIYKREISIGITAFLFATGTSAIGAPFQSMMYQAYDTNGKKIKYHNITAIGTTISLSVASVAAIIGGILSERSLVFPMIVDLMLLGVASIIYTFYIKEPPTQKSLIDRLTLTEIANDALKLVTSSRRLVVTIICSAVCFAGLRSGFNFYQPMMSLAGASLKQMGAYFACFLLFSAICAHIFSGISKNMLIRSTPILLMSILFLVSSLAAWKLNNSLIGILIAILCHQASRAMYPSYFSFAINNIIPTQSCTRTTALSIASLVRALTLSISLALTGILGDALGYTKTFYLLSFSCGIILLFLYLFEFNKE